MIETVLVTLSNSKFRGGFKLKEKDFVYINNKGLDKIKDHAYDFVKKRLAPAIIDNDGKQTAMHGHPVFIAQHATATCCRRCLYKWHHIKPGVELTESEIDYIVNLIIKWINLQIEINNQKN